MSSWKVLGDRLSLVARLLFLALAVQACETGGTQREVWLSAELLPDRVIECARRLEAEYRLGFFAEPYYLLGDVDGDGKEDVVVQLERDRGGYVVRGVGLCLSSTGQKIWHLGADNEIPYFDDDYLKEENKVRRFRFDTWRFAGTEDLETLLEEYRRKAQQYRDRLPKFVGDVLIVDSMVSESYYFYWDGKQFRVLSDFVPADLSTSWSGEGPQEERK